MVYVYIDIEGKIGKTEEPPTEQDLAAIVDGQLSVMRIALDEFGNVFPELCDPEMEGEQWYDVPAAEDDRDDEGRPFHFVV